MSNKITDSYQLIGMCLAPFDESRVSLIEKAALNIRDWGEIYRLCWDRHVSTLVFSRIQKAGLDGLMPAELRDRFLSLYMNVATQNSLRIQQALPVTSSLMDKGVKVLYFKGTSMAMMGDYTDLGQRMFSDVDVLVDTDDKDLVRGAFRENGDWYELTGGVIHPGVETKWVNDWGTLVEVHWQLFPLNAVPSAVPEKRLWSNARELTYKGSKALIPSREDRFIQSAIHSTAHHSFDSSFLFTSVADLAHLLGNHSAKMDWEGMGRSLKNECMMEHVAVAMELALDLTKYEPLAEGLREFYGLVPGLQELTRPFSSALIKMVRKPWIFTSRKESVLFARKVSLYTRMQNVLPRFVIEPVRWTLYGPRKDGNISGCRNLIEAVGDPVKYRKKMWDPVVLSYILELYRFYRRIGYAGFGKDMPTIQS